MMNKPDKFATLAIAVPIAAAAATVIMLVLYMMGFYAEWWLVLVPLLFVIGIYAAVTLLLFLLGVVTFLIEGDV